MLTERGLSTFLYQDEGYAHMESKQVLVERAKEDEEEEREGDG